MVYKVIVTDSSPSIQKAVKMALSDSEFEIYAFDDGKEVMERLSQINPDAVFLRLSILPKDGYEAGRYLKSQEQFKKTSLILLKGVFEPLDRERVAELDYDEIVQVPFASERFAQLVRDIIERKNDPQTLPEVLEMDEISSPELQTELDAGIKAFVRQEFLEVERELEKRIKAQLLSEIKAWLLNKLEEIKQERKS